MLAYLASSDFGIGYELFPVNKRIARQYLKATGNESVLFQSDWDFPSLAGNLGWSISRVQVSRGRACRHDSTDGTVTCQECGLTATAFIGAAVEWLDKHTDQVFRISGDYFDA